MDIDLSSSYNDNSTDYYDLNDNSNDNNLNEIIYIEDDISLNNKLKIFEKKLKKDLIIIFDTFKCINIEYNNIKNENIKLIKKLNNNNYYDFNIIDNLINQLNIKIDEIKNRIEQIYNCVKNISRFLNIDDEKINILICETNRIISRLYDNFDYVNVENETLKEFIKNSKNKKRKYEEIDEEIIFKRIKRNYF